MKSKYRNGFMAFGIIAIVIMLFALDMDYSDIWKSLVRMGIWFPAIVLLWFFVYLLNAGAWYIIINDEKKYPLSFWTVYKLSVTGFALNYTTPCGLMGGEPYRIMELAPYVGGSKATSSVILYVMMHIFSHFWFWFFSIFLYLVIYPDVSLSMGIMLAVIGCCCLVCIYFFSMGYRTGMTLRLMLVLAKVPGVRRWAVGFLERRRETLIQIDEQIALLHRQHKRTFYCSLGLELFARLFSSLEIYFILHAFSAEVSLADGVLILAFSSLFSNLLFFSPMQLGTREGGLALAAEGLRLTGVLGVYTGLVTRLRELCWIAIGIALIKVGNRRKGAPPAASNQVLQK